MTKTAKEWDGGLTDSSNFELVGRFICKQLISSELRVKWSSQSQNKRLQSTVPLGPIETLRPRLAYLRCLGSCCKVRSRWDRLRHRCSDDRCGGPEGLQSTVPLGPIETCRYNQISIFLFSHLLVAKYGPVGTD